MLILTLSRSRLLQKLAVRGIAPDYLKHLTSVKKLLGFKTKETYADNNAQVNENANSIEIIVSCGEDSNLKEYINDGWNIKKEYSEEKVCSWKTIAASKDCNLEKDKGCKIVQPDKIGEEKIYLLEK